MPPTYLNLDVLNVPSIRKCLNPFQHPSNFFPPPVFLVFADGFIILPVTQAGKKQKQNCSHSRLLSILPLSHSNLYPSSVISNSEMFLKAFIIYIFNFLFSHLTSFHHFIFIHPAIIHPTNIYLACSVIIIINYN